MADPLPAHDAAEIARRIGALQAEMSAVGIDALLLTGPADITYTTGFLTRFWESPTRPWFVVVPACAPPIAVIPEIGAPLMRQSHIGETRTWPSPTPPPDDDGITLLAETLGETVPARGAIGVPMGAESHLRMPLGAFARLTERLSPRSVTDATAVLRRVREVKSAPEIACIRAACEAADAAFAQVPELARSGRSLADLARQVQIAGLEGGADWVSYLAVVAGEGGYSEVISPGTERRLAAGDVLMVDIGAVRGGYFCDVDRNFAIAPQAEAVRRAQAALHAATDEALAALRPGMTAEDLHRRLAARIRAEGAEPAAGRFGHGLGLSLTEWPSIMAGDTTRLREGMVLTIEPAAVTAPGRLIVHEEVVVVRAHAAECLSVRAPAAMQVIAP